MRETILDRILGPEGLTVVYQPILQFTDDGWRLHGFEALARGPVATHMHSPDVLFEYVRRKGAERDVDRRSVQVVLQSSGPLGRCTRLNINVHASTLERDDTFAAYLEQQTRRYQWPASQITVEIVEHAPSWSGHQFNHALSKIREMGFSIALDDIGLGSSNYRMILECRPEYFKIDRFIVQGSNSDYHRRAVLRSVVELAGSFGATAIGEGIDNAADLEAVVGEGVRTVQGYLLARPATAAALGHGEFINAVAHRLPRLFEEATHYPADDWLQSAIVSATHLTPQRAVS